MTGKGSEGEGPKAGASQQQGSRPGRYADGTQHPQLTDLQSSKSSETPDCSRQARGRPAGGARGRMETCMLAGAGVPQGWD